MKISKKGEYALKALIVLALHHEKGIRTTLISEIAQREQIPPKYLEQILLSLRKGGVLVSKSGVGGGYALSRPPEEITLGEVIRIIEGPLAPLQCVSARAYVKCPDESTCGLKGVMLEVRNAVAAILDNTSIKEVARRTQALAADLPCRQVYDI
jgi:Rrf2 family transcriptional regulator, cysteine metabolism repressor